MNTDNNGYNVERIANKTKFELFKNEKIYYWLV